MILHADDGASAHALARMNGPFRAGIAGAQCTQANATPVPGYARPGLVEPALQAGMRRVVVSSW